MGEPNPHVATIVDASENFKPEQFWDPHSPPGSLQPRNPYSQKWRIKQVNLPQPFSLPGSDYWHVEMLNDYKKELPSIRVTDNHVQLRLGVLGQVADPPLTPFFFYKGIERVTYSWTDRTWQALAVAAYAGLHFAIFGALASWSAGFAAAIALNWARGRLSLPKCGVLLALACYDRVWLYWLWLTAKLIDSGLAKLAPPLRKFMWANFTVWALYVLLSPVHYYPLPFWPFAPGSFGAQEAFA